MDVAADAQRIRVPITDIVRVVGLLHTRDLRSVDNILYRRGKRGISDRETYEGPDGKLATSGPAPKYPVAVFDLLDRHLILPRDGDAIVAQLNFV